eukprot:GHVP01014090.1.p1 GENE.GHVP01014090.1~~GHVP01014090.1.p1  ORF type:complete len:106 (+),score=21.74 GHVP01014090.1:351-668(+)
MQEFPKRRNFLKIMNWNTEASKQAAKALKQQLARNERYQQRKTQLLKEAAKLKSEQETDKVRNQLYEKESELNTLNSDFAQASMALMPEDLDLPDDISQDIHNKN